MEETQPSEFYRACRNDEFDTVSRLLDQYSLEDLDKMEPNGSTALHAACYYKNTKIVQLLLDRGFTRCVYNRFNNLPVSETDLPEIKQLFNRAKTSTRFGANLSPEREELSWILVNKNNPHINIYHVTDSYDGKRLEYGLFNAENILQHIGKNMTKIDVIRRLFRRAVTEKDCTRLIQAFTAETDFYNRINDYLISHKEPGVKDNQLPIHCLSEYIDSICLNQQLHYTYEFTGLCYRSLRIKSDAELNFYEVGARLVNRTFISAIEERSLAEQYIIDSNDDDDDNKHTVVFIFEIRRHKTALDVKYMSEYRHEQEILIMINNIFKVTRVTKKPNFDVEIELRQSKSARIDQKKNKVIC